MRKIYKGIFLLILIISSLFFSSCTTPPDEFNIDQQNGKYTVEDFCPLKGDYKITYLNEESNEIEKWIYIDYIKGSRIQLRIVTPSTTIGQVIEIKDGELRLVTSRNDFYYRDDLTSYQNTTPEILLKEPIAKGTEWILPDGRKRYISGINVEVTTPLGGFKALEVTTESQDCTVFDYYVPNLGPIKTVYKTKDSTIESAVDKVENNAKLNQTVKVYYPDYYSSVLVYIKKKISLKTNDSIKDIFEEYFKSSPGKDIPKLISNNVKINRLYLNNPEQKVYIDFSKEFAAWLKANPIYEKSIIQSLVNTLGGYFNTAKVYITVNDIPYCTDAVQMSEGKAFYVDYKNIKEYK